MEFKIPNKENHGTQSGDIVTFTFQNFSRTSLPVDPKVVRVRSDVAWDDVTYSYILERSHTIQNGLSFSWLLSYPFSSFLSLLTFFTSLFLLVICNNDNDNRGSTQREITGCQAVQILDLNKNKILF